jgi:hypothetical protein
MMRQYEIIEKNLVKSLQSQTFRFSYLESVLSSKSPFQVYSYKIFSTLFFNKRRFSVSQVATNKRFSCLLILHFLTLFKTFGQESRVLFHYSFLWTQEGLGTLVNYISCKSKTKRLHKCYNCC